MAIMTSRRKYTQHLLHLYVSFGYLTGSAPFYWRSHSASASAHSRVVPITGRLDRIRYGLTLLVSASGTIITVSALSIQISRHGFFLRDERTVILVLVVIIALTSNLFHFNTAKNAHDFASTITGALPLYGRAEAELLALAAGGKHSRRLLYMFHAWLAMALSGGLSLPFLYVFVLLLRCDLNVLRGMVDDSWICAQGPNSPNPHAPVSLFTATWVVFCIVFVMQVAGAVLLVIGMLNPYLFYTTLIMRRLSSRYKRGSYGPRSRLRRLKFSSRAFSQFLRTYRSFQILQKKIDACVGDYVMTGHLPLYGLVFVLACVGLVDGGSSPPLFISYVSWVLLFCFYYCFVLSYVWRLNELTGDLLRNVRLHWQSSCGKRCVRSCRPLLLAFGAMGNFNKKNYIEVGLLIISTTINVLIMEKE